MGKAAWLAVLWAPASAALAQSAAVAPLQSPAASQGSPPAQQLTITPPPPATPEQIGAARAEADRLIAAGHAERYFVNITTGAAPQVRHLASGMTCAFTPGQHGVVMVYQTETAPGDDVSCGTTLVDKDGARILVTQYAARYPKMPTLQQELSASLASIRLRDPSVKPAEGRFSNIRIGDSPPPHDALRLEMTDGGQRLFTRTAASVVRGWVISQRITTAIANAQAADMTGELLLSLSVNEVAAARPDPQAEAQARLSTGDAAAEEAKRLLRGAPADLFSDLTAAGVTRIQHRPSGLVCRFGLVSSGNHLLGSANGVICAGADNLGAEIWEAAYAPQETADKARISMTASVAKQYPDAMPLDGFADMKGGDHLSLRFTVSVKGTKLFLRSAYGQIGDWAIYQRILTSANLDKLTDHRGEQEMIDTLAQVSGAQAKALAEGRRPPPKVTP